MNTLQHGLDALGAIDPSPLFALSLFPYLAFLHWARRSRRFPPLALFGFALTLVFVAITIVAALVAQFRYGEVLANVDGLHGGAESFLTLSNLLVLLGFSVTANRRSAQSASEPESLGDPSAAVNNS